MTSASLLGSVFLIRGRGSYYRSDCRNQGEMKGAEERGSGNLLGSVACLRPPFLPKASYPHHCTPLYLDNPSLQPPTAIFFQLPPLLLTAKFSIVLPPGTP